jgi:uncharacterized protein
MNIDKILKFFVPKDGSFFPLFEDDASNLVNATELLSELMNSSSTAEYERLYHEIKDVEHKGDIITHKIYLQLNKSFITPFDREDIHQFTSHIDDVVDRINGIGRRIYLYKPVKLLPIYKKMSVLINRSAKEIELAVSYLRDPAKYKTEISHACERVTEIEHEADDLYFRGIADLFEMEENPKELIKNNKILELLERCVDEEEDVTDSIKAILIKMA